VISVTLAATDHLRTRATDLSTRTVLSALRTHIEVSLIRTGVSRMTTIVVVVYAMRGGSGIPARSTPVLATSAAHPASVLPTLIVSHARTSQL
jgi:hypothetical protein